MNHIPDLIHNVLTNGSLEPDSKSLYGVQFTWDKPHSPLTRVLRKPNLDSDYPVQIVGHKIKHAIVRLDAVTPMEFYDALVQGYIELHKYINGDDNAHEGTVVVQANCVYVTPSLMSEMLETIGKEIVFGEQAEQSPIELGIDGNGDLQIAEYQPIGE